MLFGSRLRRWVLVLSTYLAVACTRQDSPAAPPAPPTSPVPAPPAASSQGPAPATDVVRLAGRFDLTEPDHPRMAWSASAVIARFKGTKISARLRDEGRNVFQIIIDGEPRGVLKTDPKRELYTLAEGLTNEAHEVQLYKRTEPKVGEVVFLGFEPAPDGQLLPPPPPSERRIEMIGDSITTGYGNEGPGPACSFNPNEENEYLTYGAMAARALGADHTNIAWSGKTIKEMTDLLDRTLPGREGSTWDFKRFMPQLVVVNLGTNNFAVADPGEERFVRLYLALLARVRNVYPDALIVCVLGPMLTDVYPEGHQSLTKARKYMRDMMQKVKGDAGGEKIELLELPEQRHSDGLGCGYHPSIKTQQLMADRLIAVAREKLGW